MYQLHVDKGKFKELKQRAPSATSWAWRYYHDLWSDEINAVRRHDLTAQQQRVLVLYPQHIRTKWASNMCNLYRLLWTAMTVFFFVCLFVCFLHFWFSLSRRRAALHSFIHSFISVNNRIHLAAVKRLYWPDVVTHKTRSTTKPGLQFPELVELKKK